jgi:hypothetical protein
VRYQRRGRRRVFYRVLARQQRLFAPDPHPLPPG